MNKAELISAVAEKAGLSKKDTEIVINATLDAIAASLQEGDKVQLVGRFQSRAYQKQLPDGNVVEKTAYEVSVGHLELLEGERPPMMHTVQEPSYRENAVQPQ